jgi:diguanylate cyclase (GGDEF)-like protein
MLTFQSEFSDFNTEQKFLDHHLEETQSQLRFTLLFCSIFYLAFSITDIAVLGYVPSVLTLFLARLSVAVTAAAGCWAIYRRPKSVHATRLTASAVEIVGMSAFLVVAHYRPDELHWHAMSMAIMVIVIYIYIPNRLIYSVAIAVASTSAFIILAVQTGKLTGSDMITMIMLLLLTNTFGIIAARRFQTLLREEFRTQSTLKNVSIRDHLTDCYNRHYLRENFIEHEISRTRRSQLCLTVVLCDLDNFKIVNDTYGHDGGDAVLGVFSHLLKDMTRKNIDSVVRYGGEEFLIILPETDLASSIALAERIRTTFSTTAIRIDGDRFIHATASFGVATVDFANNAEPVTLNRLISIADKLMYTAKNSGRNRVESLQLS